MSHVLFLGGKAMATVSLTKIIIDCFALKYGCEVRYLSVKNVKKKDFLWADTIFAVRATDIFTEGLAKMSRKMGKKFLLFMDDNLLELPKWMVGFPDRKKRLRKILRNTDVMLTFNALIGERFMEIAFLKKYVQINNIARLEDIIPPTDEENEKLKIVFAAGGNHEAAFDENVRPAIDFLVEHYASRIELVFVGVHPELRDYEEKMTIRYVQAMGFEQYRAFMKNERFDIGLAPLLQDRFTQYKNFNKFIEYSLCGTVGIYSNRAPNTLIIKDGYNGFLAQNTKEGWENAFERAIDCPNERRQCVKNAQQQLKNEFSEEAVVEELRKNVPELLFQAKNSTYDTIGIYWYVMRVKYFFWRILEVFYLTGAFFRQGGIRAVLKRISRHLPEKKIVNPS